MSSEGGGTSPGALFQGKSFWLSQNVPQRSRFKQLIQQNGGTIRLQEKDAEIKLVDHTRKDLPPDAFSYQYVETSLRNGRLESLERYRAGPSDPRPVGATNIPTRGRKVPYTIQDDQALWDWMQPYELDSHAPIRGNKLYQEFSLKNPRHTFQSYRDRYLKRLRGNPRPGGPQHPAPQGASRGTPVHSAVPPETREKDPQPTTPGANRKRKTPPEHDRPPLGGLSPQPKRQMIKVTPQSPRPMVPATPRHLSNTQPTPTSATPNRDNSHARDEVEIDTGRVGPVEARSPPQGADGAIDSFLLELPFFPSSPKPEAEPDNPTQDIDTWIESRLLTGKATNEQQVIQALRCTSMNPDLADKVLNSLVAGKGIPVDIPGVWTAEDDRSVEAQDTRLVQRALDKHGTEFFNTRWEYLDMARATGLEPHTDD